MLVTTIIRYTKPRIKANDLSSSYPYVFNNATVPGEPFM